MKKKWLIPELHELNVQETKEVLECEKYEEGYSESGERGIFFHKHICPRCGHNFGNGIGSHAAWKHHVEVAKCGADVDRIPQVPLS